MAMRKMHEDELDRLIQEWTSGLEDQDVTTRLQEHGESAGVVEDSRNQVENDPSYRERHLRMLDYPETGMMTIHGETIAISGLEARIELAPALGQHAECVLKDFLGMEEADVEHLCVAGAPD